MKKQAAKIRLQKGLTAKRTDTLRLKIQALSPARVNTGFAMALIKKQRLHITNQIVERRTAARLNTITANAAYLRGGTNALSGVDAWAEYKTIWTIKL